MKLKAFRLNKTATNTCICNSSGRNAVSTTVILFSLSSHLDRPPQNPNPKKYRLAAVLNSN